MRMIFGIDIIQGKRENLVRIWVRNWIEMVIVIWQEKEQNRYMNLKK